MDSKYYTPSIEEFHIGFELEYYNDCSDSWVLLTISKDTYDWDSWGAYYDDETHPFSSQARFRVKYLDREDIESLGFIHVGAMWFEIQSGEYRLRWWKNHEVDIWKGKHDMENMIIFRGVIRNKSELKRVLVQLGIE